MTKTDSSAPPPKSLIPARLTSQAAYENDCFRRSKVGTRLTYLVEGFADGGVIGVDGKWGEGKSWLATHWLASLPTTRPAVLLDAFSSEFDDDPFGSVAQALYECIQKRPRAVKLKRRVVGQLGKVAATLGLKATTLGLDAFTGGAATASVTTLTALAGKAAESVADAAVDQVEEWLKAPQVRRQALEELRAAIQEYVTKVAKGQSLIVVIDELDRCRPDYALQLLDVLKHLFDMPGLVFVMFVNREQLEASVSTQFGQAVGSGYLSKFVHAWVTLDSHSDLTGAAPSFAHQQLMKSFFERTRLGKTTSHSWGGFLEQIASCTAAMDFQARDLERLTTAIASTPKLHLLLDNRILPWLLALKIRHPSVYQGVLRDVPEAHHSAREIAAKAALRYPGLPQSGILSGLERVHTQLADPNRTWGKRHSAEIKAWEYESKEKAMEAISEIGAVIEATEG